MAADVSVTHRPPLSPEAGAEVEADDAAERRAPEEELLPLDPEEIRKRLEHTERQFRNRRKILIRGLPGDVTNQVWGGQCGAWREIPPCACAGGTEQHQRRRAPGGTSAGESKREIRAGLGEPKFGLSWVGVVGRNQLWTEGGCR